MEVFAAALEGFALAEFLRYSRWVYASVSATHLLGISLLLGAAAVLDLRLLGVGRSIDLGQFYRVVAPVSAPVTTRRGLPDGGDRIPASLSLRSVVPVPSCFEVFISHLPASVASHPMSYSVFPSTARRTACVRT